MRFLVTDIGEDELVLGYPWLATFQLKIDWKNATLDEMMQPLVIKTLGLKIDPEVARVRDIWIRRAESMMHPGEEIWVTRHEEEAIRRTSTSMEMAI